MDVVVAGGPGLRGYFHVEGGHLHHFLCARTGHVRTGIMVINVSPDRPNVMAVVDRATVVCIFRGLDHLDVEGLLLLLSLHGADLCVALRRRQRRIFTFARSMVTAAPSGSAVLLSCRVDRSAGEFFYGWSLVLARKER